MRNLLGRGFSFWGGSGYCISCESPKEFEVKMIGRQPVDLKLNIVLHKNQQFIQDTARRFNVIKCGKRFGKSYLALYRAVRRAAQCPNGVVWYIAPTYGQARDIAWSTLGWMVPEVVFTYKGRVMSNRNELTKGLFNGCQLILKGADNPQTLRGPALNHGVFDEASYFVRGDEIWTGIIAGQLMGGGTCDFISSPKDTGRNWYSEFFAEAERKQKLNDPEWAAYYYTILDNPTLNPVEVENLKNSMSEDKWNLEYMAIEGANSGLRFSEFNYAQHVSEEGCHGMLVRSIDWGIAHPTACLWANVDKDKGTVYIFDEYSKSGMLIKESCEIIKQKTGNRPVEWTTIDPSTRKRDGQTGRRDMDEFMRWGIPVQPGDNRDLGYDIVKMFFKLNKIKIHPKCKTLISELRTLQYGDTVGDDSVDCLRYLLVKVHDTLFNGLNIWPKEEVVVRKPHEYNLNEIAHLKKDRNDMSWAYDPGDEIYANT